MSVVALRRFTRPAAVAAALAGSVLAGSVLAGSVPAAADGWARLDAVRRQLTEAGAVEAGFEQSFRPAGFEVEDRESGVLALALPNCMRWDYQEPFPKSFLLCGETAWSWSEEDGAGRRQQVDTTAEPGLDLLLVDVETLRRRYHATTSSSGVETRIDLTPLEPDFFIASASLVVDDASGRLTTILYLDRDGNLNRFALQPFAPLAEPDRFTPPAEIDWEED